MSRDFLIKICGITNLDDALCACDNGASAIGFIKYPKSKRFIANTKIDKISNKLSDLYPNVKRVGVFVNDEHVNIIDSINSGINTIQFHGDESDDYINEFSLTLNNKFCNEEIKKWKAVKENRLENIKKSTACNIDMFLIDAFDDKVYGGTGKTVDWGLAKTIINNLTKPAILAGGITPDNVIEAITSTSPFGIDLSSGVEKTPGNKDHKLIIRLFKILRNVGYNIL
ncbi:MAG TPA: phosphoribosylanthranilate isomerase [Victivallales bacterium]|nr:phosphoribosylanthranilate isomerase [Victivallales bacterium]